MGRKKPQGPERGRKIGGRLHSVPISRSSPCLLSPNTHSKFIHCPPSLPALPCRSPAVQPPAWLPLSDSMAATSALRTSGPAPLLTAPSARAPSRVAAGALQRSAAPVHTAPGETSNVLALNEGHRRCVLCWPAGDGRERRRYRRLGRLPEPRRQYATCSVCSCPGPPHVCAQHALTSAAKPFVACRACVGADCPGAAHSAPSPPCQRPPPPPAVLQENGAAGGGAGDAGRRQCVVARHAGRAPQRRQRHHARPVQSARHGRASQPGGWCCTARQGSS